VTKVGIFTTTDNVPISVTIVDNNNIFKKYKTLQHDISTIQPLLNNILVKTNDNCNIDIDADKAYITSNKYLYKNKYITIRTPNKQKSIKQSIKEIKNTTNNMKNYKCKYINKLEHPRTIKSINIFEEKIKKLSEYIIDYKKNNKIQNMLGSKRYLIENYFCSLKHISKLYLRTDKLIKTFKSTIYIGFMYNYKL
jgi:hypothetical protein